MYIQTAIVSLLLTSLVDFNSAARSCNSDPTTDSFLYDKEKD
jgi:hypothetical protein